jgi:hypothetical protein
MWDEPYFGLRLLAKRNSMFHRALRLRRSTGDEFAGIFLLRALIDKHSILPICGFNGTSFVEVVDIFCDLATIASRKCSSFQ